MISKLLLAFEKRSETSYLLQTYCVLSIPGGPRHQYLIESPQQPRGWPSPVSQGPRRQEELSPRPFSS